MNMTGLRQQLFKQAHAPLQILHHRALQVELTPQMRQGYRALRSRRPTLLTRHRQAVGV